MGRLHGCWSHQYPFLFIPHRKRCKGGIAPACCRLHLMLHPLRAQWVPSRGPLGGWRSRRFRGPGPFSERWPRWVGRVFSLVFPNPLRIDHVAFPTSAAAAAPVLRSLLPLVPPRGAWRGLCASVCPSNSSPLHSDPSQPKPIASLPRLRSLQQPQTQPTCPRQRAGRRHLLLPPARAPDGPRSSVGTPPPGRWVGGISWPGVTPSPATPSRVSSTG